MQVSVRDARGRILVEASQVLPDGRTRSRSLLLSEKMIAGEAWQGAARRGISEELGSVLGAAPSITLAEGSHAVRAVRKDSQSYPGVLTVYEVSSADAHVEGLPEADRFTTTEPRPPTGQLVTHWEWRETPPAPF
jgi:hypothetical protein